MHIHLSFSVRAYLLVLSVLFCDKRNMETRGKKRKGSDLGCYEQVGVSLEEKADTAFFENFGNAIKEREEIGQDIPEPGIEEDNPYFSPTPLTGTFRRMLEDASPACFGRIFVRLYGYIFEFYNRTTPSAKTGIQVIDLTKVKHSNGRFFTKLRLTSENIRILRRIFDRTILNGGNPVPEEKIFFETLVEYFVFSTYNFVSAEFITESDDGKKKVFLVHDSMKDLNFFVFISFEQTQITYKKMTKLNFSDKDISDMFGKIALMESYSKHFLSPEELINGLRLPPDISS